MIALDTNLLIRLVVDDNPKQSDIASSDTDYPSFLIHRSGFEPKSPGFITPQLRF